MSLLDSPCSSGLGCAAAVFGNKALLSSFSLVFHKCSWVRVSAAWPKVGNLS